MKDILNKDIIRTKEEIMIANINLNKDKIIIDIINTKTIEVVNQVVDLIEINSIENIIRIKDRIIIRYIRIILLTNIEQEFKINLFRIKKILLNLNNLSNIISRLIYLLKVI